MYSKALAESITEFEPSSESEDESHHGHVTHHHGNHDDDTNGDGCHGVVSEHQHNISDSQSISSTTRLVITHSIMEKYIVHIMTNVWSHILICHQSYATMPY